MNESFTIPVVYQGQEYEFKARFERWAFSHRIAVLIGETTLIFEPDEEGSYRILTNAGDVGSNSAVDMGLLKAVADKLVKLSN